MMFPHNPLVTLQACVRPLTAKVGIRGRGVPAIPQFSEHRSRESRRLASKAASHMCVSTSTSSTSNARMVDNVDEAVEAEEEEEVGDDGVRVRRRVLPLHVRAMIDKVKLCIKVCCFHMNFTNVAQKSGNVPQKLFMCTLCLSLAFA